MSAVDVASLRKEYTLQGLYRKDLLPSPFDQFRLWFEKSVQTAGPREPNPMALATVSPEGQPTVRIVLLKGFDERGFVFFTNYESRKAAHLEANPLAALNFHWPWLERQIQIEGQTEKISRSESREYFDRRPLGSRYGAIASDQSAVIESRKKLEAQLDAVQRQFRGGDPPLPDFWGGYRLNPRRIEFWQGRENRLHDRFLYQRNEKGEWKIDRLSP